MASRDNSNATQHKRVPVGDRPHPQPMNSARFDQNLNAVPSPQEPAIEVSKSQSCHPRGCCGN